MRLRIQALPEPPLGSPSNVKILTEKEAAELLRAAEWMADGKPATHPLHKACAKLRATMGKDR